MSSELEDYELEEILAPGLLHIAVRMQPEFGAPVRVKALQHELPDDMKKQIRKLSATGKYRKIEIAEKLNVSIASVTKYAGSNAQWRNMSQRANVVTRDEALKMKADRAAGMNISQIARKYKRSESTVCRWLDHSR